MTIHEIAEFLGGEVIGNNIESAPDIERVAKIEEADFGSLTFLANLKYEKHLGTTQATAILVSRKLDLKKNVGRASLIFIRVDDPYVAFLHVLRRLTPTVELFTSGIHSTAIVPSNTIMGKNISIGSHAVVGEHAIIGDNTKIGAGCVIGNHAQVGSECMIYPNVVVYHQCKIGNRVILHSGAVIGSDGFGFAPKMNGTYEKIPQIGIVVIDDDVEIGANTTVDRGAMEETRIGRGSKIDNLVQVAHNVVIGPGCILLAQSGISGSTVLGAGVVIAGQSGAVGHIHIGDGAKVGAKSAVTKDVPPGGFVTGHPARDHRLWLRERALVGKLGQLEARLRDVEAHLHFEMGREENHD